MALVEVADVSMYALNSERLWGCRIEAPQPGSQTEIYAFDIKGWVLGRNSPAVAVELVHEGGMLRRVPMNHRRPDIAAVFPDVPGAENSGFHVNMMNVLGASLELELKVQAVLPKDTRVPIGVIRARRRSLRSDFQPRLQPLMLTTLGRTGSTWVLRLLGQHPQIIAYRPFQYEPRVASYWLRILKTLSEPANYVPPIIGFGKDGDYWRLANEPSPDVPRLVDSQIHQWLGQNNIEALAAFCQGRIEAFYEQVAIAQGQTQPIYFAEKYLPDYLTSAMIRELYPQSREIVLVRDFRDMVASILAFNAKRGYMAFGREQATSDEEYVRRLQRSVVRLHQSWKQRSDEAYLLRYEDLILRPVETLSALLEYLGLGSTPSAIKDMIERASEEIPSMPQHRTSPDIKRSIGRWRRDLDASLQASCQEAFGDVLKEFGYTE